MPRLPPVTTNTPVMVRLFRTPLPEQRSQHPRTARAAASEKEAQWAMFNDGARRPLRELLPRAGLIRSTEKILRRAPEHARAPADVALRHRFRVLLGRSAPPPAGRSGDHRRSRARDVWRAVADGATHHVRRP